MSFLNGLRGIWKNEPELDQRWIVPDQYSDIEPLLEPDADIVVIYKHSFSCGVSIFAKSRMEESIETIGEHATLVFIDVKQNRSISKKIAEVTNVRHESPQVIVLYRGEVYWHGSHGNVQAKEVIDSINEITAEKNAS